MFSGTRKGAVESKAKRFALALLSGAIPLCNGARAQDSELQDVSPNTSVTERFYSNFDALGWKVGGFTVLPDLAAGVDYDDNIFGSSGVVVDDFIGVFEGALNVSSNWSVHRIRLSSSISRRQLFDNSDESTTNYRVAGEGLYELGRRVRLNASGRFARLAEPRIATQTAAGAERPVQYSTVNANASVSLQYTRFSLSSGLSFAQADFNDAISAVDGSLIDQDFRDSRTYVAYARNSFRLRPAIATFAEAQLTRSDYQFPRLGAGAPVFQDSDGYRLLGGVAFDINKVARGEVSAGFERRNFDSAAFGDVSGPSVNAEIEYFLSGLTTISMAASRSIEDSVVLGDGSFETNRLSVTVDHELLRNFIISASGRYQLDQFRGFDRRDNLLTLQLGAQYLLGRQTLVRLEYSFADLSSSGASSRGGYQRNVLGLSIQYRL